MFQGAELPGAEAPGRRPGKEKPGAARGRPQSGAAARNKRMETRKVRKNDARKNDERKNDESAVFGDRLQTADPSLLHPSQQMRLAGSAGRSGWQFTAFINQLLKVFLRLVRRWRIRPAIAQAG